MKVKKILFLGYDRTKTCLQHILECRGCIVDHSSEKLFKNDNYDLIISFGYRHIIPEELIVKCPPILNLHISYLPFNKGAHPNFWSHYDGTPSGVSIHLIDAGIDTGPILFRKKVEIDITKLTFQESYEILFGEIERLFIQNIEAILLNDLTPINTSEIGTYHSLSDLPTGIDWTKKINIQLQELKEILD